MTAADRKKGTVLEVTDKILSTLRAVAPLIELGLTIACDAETQKPLLVVDRNSADAVGVAKHT